MKITIPLLIFKFIFAEKQLQRLLGISQEEFHQGLVEARSHFHEKRLLSVQNLFRQRLDELLGGGRNEREDVDDGGAKLEFRPAQLGPGLVGVDAVLEPLLQMLHKLEAQLLVEYGRKELRQVGQSLRHAQVEVLKVAEQSE